MHSSAELTATTTRVIILLTFLRIPLSPSLSLEFALPVLFALLIHHAAVCKFLTTLLCCHLLTLHK
jgi:hypothetical protein